MAASDTKLLLHCDGIDGSPTFTDATGNHTVTRYGTAQIDTAYKKWGTGSGLFDGNSDYLGIPNSSDWDISTNFTVELQARHTDHAGTEEYILHYENATNNWVLYHVHGSGIRFFIYSNEAIIVDTGSGGEITDTNWHHVAMCKVGNEYGVYKDGTQVAHTSDASMDTFTGLLRIGVASANFFDGHMDEIRIVHANPFGAAPNAGLTDTITVPTGSYGVWLHKFMGISDPAKAIGVNINYISKILGVS